MSAPAPSMFTPAAKAMSLMVMLSCLVVCAQPSPSITDEEIKTMLRDNVETDRQAVGLAVGIVDGHGARVVCHGKLDNGTSLDVDGDTLFEIGSVTKVFTALLLQDMVERGEMKLDDPVQIYLPASARVPTYNGKPITLLHLATHTSGLPREANNYSPQSWRNPGAGYTAGQLYSFLSHCKLPQAPGMREAYSNVGMVLLGHAIALKAGKDYESLVLERICRPLGMDSTRVILTPELKSRLATGHAMPGRSASGVDFSDFPAAGALHSTASDMLKFLSAYMGLTPSPLNLLMQNAAAYHSLEGGKKRRLAWGGAESLFCHSGGTLGYHAELAFDSKRRRGVVVLSNCSNSRIAEIIWRPLLEGRPPKPTKSTPANPALYDRYVGQYQNDKGDISTVRREDGRFIAQWFGHPDVRRAGFPSFEVFPLSESVFCNEFWGNQTTLVTAADGSPIKIVLASQTGSTVMTRIATNVPAPPIPVQIDSKSYDGHVGRYRHAFFFGLFHIGPSFNIRRETDELGDHLVGYITGKHLDLYLPDLSHDLHGGELFPESETTFFSPLLADKFRITFVRNKKGKTTQMIFDLNGSKFKAARVSKRPAT